MLFIIGSVTAKKKKKVIVPHSISQWKYFCCKYLFLINNESLLLLPPIRKKKFVCSIRMFAESVFELSSFHFGNMYVGIKVHDVDGQGRKKKDGRWQRIHSFYDLFKLSGQLNTFYQFYWMHRSGVKILKISFTIVIEACSREIATLIRAMIVNRCAKQSNNKKVTNILQVTMKSIWKKFTFFFSTKSSSNNFCESFQCIVSVEIHTKIVMFFFWYRK